MGETTVSSKVRKLAALVILGALVCLVLAGCSSSKTPKTTDEFTADMEAAGFTVQDASDQFSSDEVDKVVIALNENYQIEFYDLPSASDASAAYSANKTTFEDQAGSASTNSELSGSNYGKYTQTANGSYYVVSYIDDTMVYCVCDETYKTDVETMIKNLGYL